MHFAGCLLHIARLQPLLVLREGGAGCLCCKLCSCCCRCCLQEEQAAVMRTFPPRTLPELVAQREVLLTYASAEPAAVLVGFCATYILMQVRDRVCRHPTRACMAVAATPGIAAGSAANRHNLALV